MSQMNQISSEKDLDKPQYNIGLDLKDLLDVTGMPGISELEEETVLPPMELPTVQQNPDNVEQDLDNDYQIVRQVQIHQLAMLSEVAKQMVEVVRNSESPKTVEIFSGLMDTITRTNSAVLDNYGKMKKLKNQESKPKSVDVQFESIQSLSPSELLQQNGTREDYLVQEQYSSNNSSNQN